MSVDLESLGYNLTSTRVWAREGTAEFGYSDGDATENRLARVIASVSDVSTGSAELADRIRDWPSLYHLSQVRGNLLRPLLPMLEGPVLELGAGMGAITRTLGEAGLEVVAVEGSRRRAEICAQRTRDLPNVSVVADTIQGFGRPAQFRTVLLIGVLEYARMFGLDDGEGTDPVDTLLQHVTALAGEQGQLVLAIENQLGLKYLAGFPEDHLNQRMVGIEDTYDATTPVTFGQTELTQRLDTAGLVNQQWYYPFPDYKLPRVVLTDRAFDPDSGFDPASLIVGTAHGDAQEPEITTFDPELAYDAVLRNGLMPALSNSFLVRASAAPMSERAELGWYFGPVTSTANAKHVAFVANDDGIDVQTRRHEKGSTDVSHPYVKGRQWSETARRIVATPGWRLDDLKDWLAFWVRCISELSEHEHLDAQTVLSPELLDAIPRNLIVDQGSGQFIDLEWSARQPLTFGFLTFRALLYTLVPIRWGATAAEDTPTTVGALITALAATCGVTLGPTTLKHHWQTEHDFQVAATGTSPQRSLDQTLSVTIPVRRTIDDIIADSEQAQAATVLLHAVREEREDLLLSLDARERTLHDMPPPVLQSSVIRTWARRVPGAARAHAAYRNLRASRG
ncbi:MAG: hypothetical protein FWD18_11350 [Micrococcales bacterium]|nr:hypothetical protein [Micrococcales bacterium]